MRWLRALAACVAILALVIVGAGCGSDEDSGSSSDAKALLNQAFASTGTVQSGDLEMLMKADVQGSDSLDGPLALRLDGPYKSNGKKRLPSLDWDISFNGAGQKLTGGLVATANNVFLSFQGQPFELGEGTFADLTSQLDLKDAGNPLSPRQLGMDPASWIEDPKVEDGDPIGGDDTRKVTGDVDVRKVVKDMVDLVKSPAVRKRLESQGAGDANIPEPSEKDLKEIEDAIEDVDVEVSVDEDEVLRRFFTEVDFDAADDGNGKDLKGKFSFTYVLREVGGDPVIRAPANPRPLKELLGGLGLGSFGGAGAKTN